MLAFGAPAMHREVGHRLPVFVSRFLLIRLESCHGLPGTRALQRFLSVCICHVSPAPHPVPRFIDDVKVFNAENIPEQADMMPPEGDSRRAVLLPQVLANTEPLIAADFFNFESMKSKSLAAARKRTPSNAEVTRSGHITVRFFSGYGRVG